MPVPAPAPAPVPVPVPDPDPDPLPLPPALPLGAALPELPPPLHDALSAATTHASALYLTAADAERA
jgi:fused signal recognition particle receptor